MYFDIYLFSFSENYNDGFQIVVYLNFINNIFIYNTSNNISNPNFSRKFKLFYHFQSN